jgi:hypothetical protein
MAANYVLLEKITVGAAGASSVTFSGIPQTGYTDLVVKVCARFDGSGGADYVYLQFNSDTNTSNYKSIFLRGNGTTTASASATTEGKIRAAIATSNAETANTFSNCEIYIPNYTGSNNKSTSSDWVPENNATATFMGITAGLWSQTTAITSIQLTLPSNSFVQYSTFYLYGVAKLGTTPAIVPYATGGDTIMTDGTYWYHTFISSGTFTPQKAISCDYLVVAGGGGGGFQRAAGGGAGGLRSTVTATGGGGSLESALSLGTSAYTVTIGGGGAGGATSIGSPGSNSVFSTITSTGGGYGAGIALSGPVTNGGNGGSGGGGTTDGVTGTSFGTGGTGTSNQGFAGGSSNGASNYPSGGGGGAGAVGGNATTSTAGSGGNGVATSISGSSVTYAGGGGGSTFNGGTAGSGGSGGGGAGGAGSNPTANNGTPGTANLGGGGGGGNASGVGTYGSGGAGGSGIVIIRYAV